MVYSSLIAIDKKSSFEKTRDYIEYLVSFTEGKAVAEVRLQRGQDSDHKSSSEEFEKQMSSREFLSEDIVDLLNKKENTNLSDNNVVKKKSISGRMISRAIED